jgi:hypothetical protein
VKWSIFWIGIANVLLQVADAGQGSMTRRGAPV